MGVKRLAVIALACAAFVVAPVWGREASAQRGLGREESVHVLTYSHVTWIAPSTSVGMTPLVVLVAGIPPAQVADVARSFDFAQDDALVGLVVALRCLWRSTG